MERTGRVVRLHFSCRAEIPLGSFLQVTGTTPSSPSVRMVTTPDTYPVWRTRQPVVVVLTHGKRTTQHYYYRYSVVNHKGEEWEDPFGVHNVSTEEEETKDLRNLPFRTIDIDCQSVEPPPVLLDHWNDEQDDTFQSFVIRRAMQPRVEEAATHSSGQATPPAFSPNNRIFFVCFHLPVVVVQNPQTGAWRASWSESILAKTEGSQILSTYEAYWVGTVTTHPPLASRKDQLEVQEILKEMNCIPIFIEDQVREAHYYGFCKQVLWPAFHNIDLLDLSTSGWLSQGHTTNTSDWDQSRLDNWWGAYIQVNHLFAKQMHELERPGDILWIHDYHLALLPQQLSQLEEERFGWKVSRKVFFLHIPFPTSQVFRELECGERLLEGMLEADVVGFHAFDHARHFLNAAKRILGLNYESLVGGLIGVNFKGKTVLVTMSNVSIEPRMVDAALLLPSVEEGCQALKTKHKGRQIICGLDIGQRLSGINLKLLAFERMLQDYPTWQSQVVMVQRVLVPGSRQTDEDVTTKEDRALVQRITAKFGPEVIDYQEVAGSTLPMDQRLALWKASDVMMSTPIREGLNHWPMEFIHVHKEPEEAGVVINSEFSAIHSILNGALRVNPFDIQNTIIVMDKALCMNREEKEGRRYRDIDFASTSPSDKWVKNVLRDLRDATMCQPPSSSKSSSPHGSTTPLRKEMPTTASFLTHEANMAFTHLSFSALLNAYRASQRRVIITDFNGTIVLKEPPGKYLKRDILGTSGNKPPPQVIEALHVLCQDPKNTVYVVSGDSSENVINALGHVPNLGLAVSNGACFAHPLQQEEISQPRKWLTFDLGVNWDDVKKVALPVLAKYTARSNGSFVKLTSFSIGWSYYSCDPEWGSLQASHLVLELESELRAFDVRFVTLKGIVEIVPRKLNKGLIVKKVLSDVSRQHPEDGGVDFCLCLGDDISDEKMFSSVFSFMAEWGQGDANAGPRALYEDGTVEEPAMVTASTTELKKKSTTYAFTVAVGKKQSVATSYVNDAQEVANALVLLAEGQVPAGGVTVGEDSATDMFD